jgi:uncharacterized protein (DUF433 family)
MVHRLPAEAEKGGMNNRKPRDSRSRPLFGLIWINRERVSGTPCFYATRVPVKTLFDCLVMGETLDEFLDNFEGVARDQAIAALELAGSDLLAALESV